MDQLKPYVFIHLGLRFMDYDLILRFNSIGSALYYRSICSQSCEKVGDNKHGKKLNIKCNTHSTWSET